MEWINEKNKAVQQRIEKGCLRTLRPIEEVNGLQIVKDGKTYWNLSSNDYLGLRFHKKIIEANIEATRRFGSGSGSSRYISGNTCLYQQLEENLSEWLGESVLIFSNGFTLNSSLIPVFFNKDDMIFADRHIHRSMIDGILFSGAQLIRYPHQNMSALEEKLKKYRKDGKRALIITEGLFSMTGDMPEVKELVRLKHKYDCQLYLDEAHSIGIYGEQGRGWAYQNELLDEIDFFVGTFGKGFGGYGAFLRTKKELRDYLINFVPSLIYTTALPPGTLAANIASLKIIQSIEGDALRTRLQKRSKTICDASNISPQYPILPISFDQIAKTEKLYHALMDAGYYTVIIRPPTVPQGQDMIRLSICANMPVQEILKLKEFFSLF